MIELFLASDWILLALISLKLHYCLQSIALYLSFHSDICLSLAIEPIFMCEPPIEITVLLILPKHCLFCKYKGALNKSWHTRVNNVEL